jgi:hypothetical protein
MNDFVVVVVAIVAVVLVSLAGRAIGKRSRPPYSGGAQSGAVAPAEATPVDGTLVAVIAAAIAAASGMAPGSFRVVGIESSARPNYGSRGLNTPAWGHVERFNRGE